MTICAISVSVHSLATRLIGANERPGSGQWWQQCPPDERDAYENDLQGKLMGGMQYLWDNPQETGTIGLRFLQNVDDNDEKIKETCGAGFFRNWSDLEVWSSTHPSHLAIFVGALNHGEYSV